MPINPPASAPSTWLDILMDALIEIGALAPGEPVKNRDSVFGLRKINRLLDVMAARRIDIYSITDNIYTLTPGLSPHTIGPNNATFTLTQRPVKIEHCNLIFNNVNPVVRRPMDVYQGKPGAEWWASVRVQGLQSAVPHSLYYSPDFPNGNLFFWPVPSVAYQVELGTWTLLPGPVQLTDTISLPPAYQDAITWTLAEMLWPSYHPTEELTRTLAGMASRARSIVASVNSSLPPLATRDFGLRSDPGASGVRGDFNWLTGERV